ncbi:MAG: DUF3465 domain-containing protein [Kiritimatiellae bacterium]|jgi:hypothetical protein|nr:DUF3465 domain-containing protein [Kiritimatiellia bacterium]
MKKFLIIVLLIAGGVYYYYPTLKNFVPQKYLPQKVATQEKQNSNFTIVGSRTSSGNTALNRAFRNRTSDLQVSGSGRVSKTLSDDTKGSRHQRFILKLDSGQTLLVAHNIDLAPRINSLRVGDTVAFNGEYEWNSKGGVVHWTHHDPPGGSRHVGGWLKHKGRTYK